MATSSEFDSCRMSTAFSDPNCSLSLCRASSYTVARRCSGSLLTESIMRERTSANSTSVDEVGAAPFSGPSISEPMDCSASDKRAITWSLTKSNDALEPIFGDPVADAGERDVPGPSANQVRKQLRYKGIAAKPISVKQGAVPVKQFSLQPNP